MTAKLKKVHLQAKESEIDHKIYQIEEMYQRIRQSTGINDIHDILERLNSQKDTSDHISTLIKEAEIKITTLSNELEASKNKLKEIQFSGLGNIGKQRQEITVFEQKVSTILLYDDVCLQYDFHPINTTTTTTS